MIYGVIEVHLVDGRVLIKQIPPPTAGHEKDVIHMVVVCEYEMVGHVCPLCDAVAAR
mgnify:CR=1 FL=1